MTIWMKVTHDKYKHPVAIADSCVELANLLGKTANNISSSISHSKKRGDWTPYRKVEIDNEEG